MYITLAYGLGGALGGLVVSGLWVRFSPAVAFYGAAAAALAGLLATAFCVRGASPDDAPD